MTAKPSTRPRFPQHARASDLVRFMTRANRVNATHLRLVVAHMAGQRGSLSALLDHDFLRDAVGLEINDEAWTVDALACEMLGTGFHALTFSLGPDADRGFPAQSRMTLVPPKAEPKPPSTTEPGATVFELVRRWGRWWGWRPSTTEPGSRVFEDLAWRTFDTARRPTSVFDGTTRHEFLLQLPSAGDRQDDRLSSAPVSFRRAITDVAHLAVHHGRPLAFVHAPATTPSKEDIPREMTQLGLRFAVAIPREDDAGRLDFGTDLVHLSSKRGYGLWQSTTSADVDADDYWDQVVPPGTRTDNTSNGPLNLPNYCLAITCVGPARVGSTKALLDLLARAQAPVWGLSGLTLNDIAIIHLLTHMPDSAIVQPSPETSADLAIAEILDLKPRFPSEKLQDYRLLASYRPTRPPDADLTVIWLTWKAPATTDALRLTLDSLRNALDIVWARHRADAWSHPRDDHLNIEYIACRNTTWADRLQGRIQVAVDTHAFRPPGDRLRLATPDGNDVVTTSQLGRFCNDVKHQWREALSLALGTPSVDVNVVWSESWLLPQRSTPSTLL